MGYAGSSYGGACKIWALRSAMESEFASRSEFVG